MQKLNETFKEASLGYKQSDEIYVNNMSNKMYFLLAFLLGVGIILIGDAFFVLPLIGLAKGEVTTEFLNDYQGFTTLASKIASIVIIYLGLRKILKKDLIKTKKSLLSIIILVLIGFGIMAGLSFLFNYINTLLPGFEEAVNEEGVNAILEGKSKIPYAICILTLTPFVEEVVFRKLAFSCFKETKLPRFATILIVAFIFALIHCLGENPLTWTCYYNFLQYFLLSLTITLVYAFSNENVFASTLLHILNNAMALILFFV